MNEFGHIGYHVGDFHIDAWGAGPFVLATERESFEFEDSKQFGPQILTKDGDIAEKQPGAKSPFWPAHLAWTQQGRKVADDGFTCLWEPLKPTTYRRTGGRHAVVVEHGDEGGGYVEVKA